MSWRMELEVFLALYGLVSNITLLDEDMTHDPE